MPIPQLTRQSWILVSYTATATRLDEIVRGRSLEQCYGSSYAIHDQCATPLVLFLGLDGAAAKTIRSFSIWTIRLEQQHAGFWDGDELGYVVCVVHVHYVVYGVHV